MYLEENLFDLFQSSGGSAISGDESCNNGEFVVSVNLKSRTY